MSFGTPINKKVSECNSSIFHSDLHRTDIEGLILQINYNLNCASIQPITNSPSQRECLMKLEEVSHKLARLFDPMLIGNNKDSVIKNAEEMKRSDELINENRTLKNELEHNQHVLEATEERLAREVETLTNKCNEAVSDAKNWSQKADEYRHILNKVEKNFSDLKEKKFQKMAGIKSGLIKIQNDQASINNAKINLEDLKKIACEQIAEMEKNIKETFSSEEKNYELLKSLISKEIEFCEEKLKTTLEKMNEIGIEEKDSTQVNEIIKKMQLIFLEMNSKNYYFIFQKVQTEFFSFCDNWMDFLINTCFSFDLNLSNTRLPNSVIQILNIYKKQINDYEKFSSTIKELFSHLVIDVNHLLSGSFNYNSYLKDMDSHLQHSALISEENKKRLNEEDESVMKTSKLIEEDSLKLKEIYRINLEMMNQLMNPQGSFEDQNLVDNELANKIKLLFDSSKDANPSN